MCECVCEREPRCKLLLTSFPILADLPLPFLHRDHKNCAKSHAKLFQALDPVSRNVDIVYISHTWRPAGRWVENISSMQPRYATSRDRDSGERTSDRSIPREVGGRAIQLKERLSDDPISRCHLTWTIGAVCIRRAWFRSEIEAVLSALNHDDGKKRDRTTVRAEWNAGTQVGWVCLRAKRVEYFFLWWS